MIPKQQHNFEIIGGRNIYNALYDTLVYLKPKYCLEIGTFHGKSAAVFQKYFNDYQPYGKLVTIDIKKYIDLSHMPNIIQLIVHPHVKNSTQWHYVTNDELLPYVEQSYLKNIHIIQQAFTDIMFDFCFLDGDHQLPSIQNDFLIARLLLKYPQYILFDDIDIVAHESMQYYLTNIKTNPNLYVYDYSDRKEWTGAALIWNKE